MVNDFSLEASRYKCEPQFKPRKLAPQKFALRSVDKDYCSFWVRWRSRKGSHVMLQMRSVKIKKEWRIPEKGQVEEHHKSQRSGGRRLKMQRNSKLTQHQEQAACGSCCMVPREGRQAHTSSKGNPGSPGEEVSGSLQGNAHRTHRL